ncbi:MAG: TldD/PmbA family protein [Defluviimonas sp.]|uniref:TldD/PmbA family protein n=1 Tax=Albidovulum sp. TaxID=1872424 RepID=UPI002A3413EE|nr:TldD/PmbA family protein [Defluviimonas sp.]
MTDRLSRLAEMLLIAATRAGADAADALAVDGTSISIDVRDGKLEQAERAEGIEIGLRVLTGNRQACVSASDVSERTIGEMAERAVAMARAAPADDSLGLARPEDLARGWDLAALDLVDPAREPAAAELEALARDAEAAALSVAGVTRVQSASATFSRRRIHLAATNGFSGGYSRSGRSVSAVATAGEGLKMERDWAAESRVYASDMPAAEAIGRLAGERAVARLGARKPRTGAFPVLYDERVAGGLIGHLLAAANGSAIVRGGSWLRDMLGEQVLPAGLSIHENPLRPRIGGSRPFDAEGLASSPRDIVRFGVLQGWTLDLGTARRLGMRSTGSASRGAGSPPAPSVSNIALTQGDRSPAQLMEEMGTGLYVTGLIGASINPTTGDYSRGASGFWIENGAIAFPVNECTIAGNLREMLLRIQPANDALAHRSHVVPSLLVEGLTLAGD